MQNHCVYATCTNCATEFCIRCNDYGKVGETQLQRIRDKQAAGFAVKINDLCPGCGSKKQVFLN